MAKEKKSGKKALVEYARVMASRAGLRFREEELEVVARMHHEGASGLREEDWGMVPMPVVYRAD